MFCGLVGFLFFLGESKAGGAADALEYGIGLGFILMILGQFFCPGSPYEGQILGTQLIEKKA
jgi:hypothetical protein